VRRTLRLFCLFALLVTATVAHADIAEQRRRLPPPPENGCTDPIAGDWQSQFWTRGSWLVRTLRLRRVTPGAPQLNGVELVEAWYGPHTVESRPTCAPGSSIGWYLGESTLSGSFDGARIDVQAAPFQLRSILCGAFNSYSPDHFRGTLESAGTELHTRNDDGRNPETTVVFRRVSCVDGSTAPSPSPPPTPFVAPPPPRAEEGCASYLPGR